MTDTRSLIDRLRNPMGPPDYLVMQEAADWIEDANRLLSECMAELEGERDRLRPDMEAE